MRSARDRMKIYREKLKQDVDLHEAYKAREVARNILRTDRTLAQKKGTNKEKKTARNSQEMEGKNKLKNEGIKKTHTQTHTPLKPLKTRTQIKLQRQKWREQKQLQKSQMTSQKKRRITFETHCSIIRIKPRMYAEDYFPKQQKQPPEQRKLQHDIARLYSTCI